MYSTEKEYSKYVDNFQAAWELREYKKDGDRSKGKIRRICLGAKYF